MHRIVELEQEGIRLVGILGREYFDRYPELVSKERILEIVRQLGVNPKSIVYLQQEHTNRVVVIKQEFGREVVRIKEPADGIITDIPSLLMCITVADCVPIIVVDTKLKILGVLHAGREGTRKKIVWNALELFKTEYGSRVSDIKAHIGPSIGPCCYTVSEDLLLDCRRDGLVVTERNTIDLWSSNENQLMEWGVNKTNITIAKTCTCCSNNYFSYRRGDRMKRNYVVAML